MRVVHFGNYVPGQGGISSVLAEFASWSWRDVDLRFIDTYASQPRFFGLKRMLVALRYLLRNRKSIDVAHIHLSQGGSFLREGLLVHVAARLTGRVVVTTHGSSMAAFLAARPRLVRSVLSRANVICCYQTEVASDLRRIGVNRQIVVVPNAIKPSKAAVQPARESNKVVFAGAVDRRKGVDTLYEAWGDVIREMPWAQLEVYGPVHLSPPDSLANVRMHGQSARSAVLQAMATCRIVVLPSRAEAFPMTLVEAMSLARPVVASTVGAVPTLVGRKEQLVPPGDAAVLAQKLLAILSSTGLTDELAASNLDRFLTNYSDATVMAQLRTVYAQVCAVRRS